MYNSSRPGTSQSGGVGSRLGLDDDDEDEINVDGDDSEDGFEEDTGVDQKCCRFVKYLPINDVTNILCCSFSTFSYDPKPNYLCSSGTMSHVYHHEAT